MADRAARITLARAATGPVITAGSARMGIPVTMAAAVMPAEATAEAVVMVGAEVTAVVEAATEPPQTPWVYGYHGIFFRFVPV
jgi:hypothetical protein